ANRIDLPGKFLRRIERLDGMRQYALRVAHAAEYVVHCRGVAFFESFCEIHLPPPSRLRTPGGGRASITSFQLSVPLRNLRHPYCIPWNLCERAPHAYADMDVWRGAKSPLLPEFISSGAAAVAYAGRRLCALPRAQCIFMASCPAKEGFLRGLANAIP